MSEDEHSQEPSGPLMIAATKILRAPPTRISSLGAVTLPRSVEVRTLALMALCALPGLLFGVLLFKLQGLLFGGIIGGAAGYVLATWSPVKGETLFQYLGAAGHTRLRQRPVTYRGEPAALYIGVARITRIHAGEVHLFPGAVEVHPDSRDERGALRSAENRNLDSARQRVRVARPEFRSARDLGMGPDRVRSGRVVSDGWLQTPPAPVDNPAAEDAPVGSATQGAAANTAVPVSGPHRPGPAPAIVSPAGDSSAEQAPAPRRRIPRPDDPTS